MPYTIEELIAFINDKCTSCGFEDMEKWVGIIIALQEAAEYRLLKERGVIGKCQK